MPTFDLDAARKAGYTDDQIAQGLAVQQGMDYAAAVKAGYSATDMLPSLVQGITQAKPADAAKPGMLDDIGNAVRSTGEKIGAAWLKGAQALGDAIPSLKDEGLSAPAVPQDTRSLDQLSADLNRDAIKHAPQTIPGQVAGALTYAPLGASAPLVMGASEGVARRQALLDQGVDASTANKAGLAEGVLQGAIGALPLGEFVTGAGGKVLAKSVASSVGKAAAAGAGQSVASDAATQAYLDANGYDEQAKQFAPSVEKAAEGALFMGAFHGGMQGAHLVAGKAFDAATGNMAPQEAPAPSRDAVPNQSVVDQLRTVLGEPSPATGAVPRADLHASKEATIAQAKAADPVATADAVLAAPTIDDAMQAADSIINAPLPGLRDLTDGSDVRAAVDVGMGQPQTQPSTQTATDANLAGADGAFKVQPIEGQGNGIDTAGTERGTDGLGRSGGPADEVGSDLSAGRAGTGTGVIEGERDGSGLPAEKRGTDAVDYRTGADGAADTKPALTQPENANVPERPQVPEEAPLARGEEGARQADTGAGATAGAGTQVAPAARDVAAARRGKVLEIERDDKTSATYRILDDDGKQIGHVMTLKRKASADGHIVDVMQIHNAGINDAASKGKGYGIRAYTELVDQALADGKHVWSDPSVSAEGARMYEALKRRGYKVEGNAQKPAVKDEDGTLVSNGNFVFKITAGPNAQAKPEGKLAARRALNDRQDTVVKAAAEKLAARKAEKDAAAQPAEEAPAPDANPARAEPPLSFMKKVKVDHDVYISDERRWETVKVQAHIALKSVREDIGNLEALLKCMRG